MTSGESAAWQWVPLEVVLAIHDRKIAEHGGAEDVLDPGLADSALARPLNLESYGDPDAAALAAAYAYGLASNHGFADGNKRVAWVAARLFLLANGWSLAFDPFDAIRVMEAVSSGQASEEGLASWFRVRLAT